MTGQGGCNVSGTFCWKQLTNLTQLTKVLSNFAQPMQCSTVPNETPFEKHVPLEEFSISQIDYGVTADNESITTGGLQAS